MFYLLLLSVKLMHFYPILIDLLMLQSKSREGMGKVRFKKLMSAPSNRIPDFANIYVKAEVSVLVHQFIWASPRSAYSIPWSLLQSWLSVAATSDKFFHISNQNREDRDFHPWLSLSLLREEHCSQKCHQGTFQAP